MTKSIFRKGLRYMCTNSTSPGYKKGSIYECYLNAERDLCLRGDDGMEDLVKNLVSVFKEVGK